MSDLEDLERLLRYTALIAAESLDGYEDLLTDTARLARRFDPERWRVVRTASADYAVALARTTRICQRMLAGQPDVGPRDPRLFLPMLTILADTFLLVARSGEPKLVVREPLARPSEITDYVEDPNVASLLVEAISD